MLRCQDTLSEGILKTTEGSKPFTGLTYDTQLHESSSPALSNKIQSMSKMNIALVIQKLDTVNYQGHLATPLPWLISAALLL
jgi:hypothetical protein